MYMVLAALPRPIAQQGTRLMITDSESLGRQNIPMPRELLANYMLGYIFTAVIT